MGANYSTSSPNVLAYSLYSCSHCLYNPCSTGQQYVDANPDLAMTTVTFNVDEEDEYDGNLIGVPKGEVDLLNKE